MCFQMATRSGHDTARQDQRPYYVVTPAYATQSAGVRALHLTVHHLNQSGQCAFVAIMGDNTKGRSTSDQLITPVLSAEIAEDHFKKRLAPIVVYPEVVTGNPLRADAVVRFYLNYPGLLGGSADVNADEIRFGYSRLLAEKVGAAENVLHVPVIDTAMFSTQPMGPRNVTCFYAHKYKQHFRGQVFGLPADCVEITRDWPSSPDDIAKLLRQSRRLYLFEDSALGTEAVLCGCPVVLMHNEHFKASPLLVREIGENGFANSDDAAAIERAESTIDVARHNYFSLWERFPQQLAHFVSVTQANAVASEYTTKVDIEALTPSDVPQTRAQRMLAQLGSLPAALRHMLTRT